MNQMNMNMNQMGMNDTFMTNFAMDNTALKIKAIIEPYEKKIIELEKTIRQKDFEILVLKEKLNTYKQSQMNNNSMSMDNNNQMGMNMGNQMGMNMNNNQMGMNNNPMGMNMGNNMGMGMDNNNPMGMNMGMVMDNNNPMGMNMGNQMGMNMNNNQMVNQMGMNMGNDMNMMNQNIMNPMMNPLLINNQPNWMLQYDPNFNNQNLILNDGNNSANLINVIFVYKEKKYNEVCNFNEKTQKVVQKFCDKMGININNYKYIFNAKKLDLSLTVAEAGMADMSTIFMFEPKPIQANNFNLNNEKYEIKEQDRENEEVQKIQKINIIFRTTKGWMKNMLVNANISIETLIQNYLKSINKEDLIGNDNKISYIYRAKKINIKDKTKVKDFFRDNIINPIIIVNDVIDFIYFKNMSQIYK